MDGNGNDLSKQFEAASKRPAKPVIYVDVDAYQHHLDGLDLTPEQKREIIVETWNLMVSFIDAGFEVQPATKACGKDKNHSCGQDKCSCDGVECDHTDLTETHDNAPEAV